MPCPKSSAFPNVGVRKRKYEKMEKWKNEKKTEKTKGTTSLLSAIAGIPVFLIEVRNFGDVVDNEQL